MSTILENTPVKQLKPAAGYKKIIERWTELVSDCSEADLATNFMSFLFTELGITINCISTQPSIGQGCVLKPDYLIYQDSLDTPVLVVEIKRRTSDLASVDEKDFAEKCRQNSLYKEAFGCTSLTKNNGIRQYLDIDKVAENKLASYGLIFNGDFFQLWRRVDGLVFPLTPIQKVTKKSLPNLLKQLQKCLFEKPMGLVTGIWNRKGGVAKTTNTINIAATLALEKKKVLLIDFDPQGDVTHGLGLDTEKLADFLIPVTSQLQLNEVNIAWSILKSSIQSKSFPTTDGTTFNLSLISTDKQALEEFRDGEIDGTKGTFSPIKTFIAIIELLKREYDYIFIDASPVLDELVQCLLFTCDHILTPIDGDKAIRHALEIDQEILPKFRQIRWEKQLGYAPLNLGLLRSNWSIAENSVIEKLLEAKIQKECSGTQYETRIRQYSQIQTASIKQAPVVCWRNSPVSKLFNELVDEVFLKHNFII
jgi:chromosome partitioning protein